MKAHGPRLDRETAGQFLRWRYGDGTAQLVYGESFAGAPIPPDKLDALFDRVGGDKFHFAAANLGEAWTGTTPTFYDVESCPFLWFDFDAEKFDATNAQPSDASREHYAHERARIKRTLDDTFSRLGIRPSAMWFSGAGYQGLFRLDRAICPAQAEALNKRLAVALGSDKSVANANRILRVPGSVNPKTEHGRVPTATELCYLDDSVTTVEAIEAALREMRSPTVPTKAAREDIAVDKDAARDFVNTFTIASLHARGVADHALLSLEHGGDRVKLHKLHEDIGHRVGEGPYNSDSEMLEAIAGALYRAGFSPEEQAGVLGTRTFAGCKHVTKQKDSNKAWRAITRAIQSARSKTIAQQKRQAMTAAGVPIWRDCYDEDGLLPMATLANAVIAVNALGIECRKDLFHNSVILTCGDAATELNNLIGEFSDDAVRMIRSFVNNKWRLDLGDKNVLDGVMEIALGHAFDPVLDYLDGLKWDGTPRLDRAAVEYFNAPDTSLNCAFVATAIIGSVRRARQAGCKFDAMVVLESDEGFNKSSAIRVLYGAENYSDQTVMGLSDREVQEQLSGVWGHECADLSGMTKAEVERVKSYMTRRIDIARPAYGRMVKKQPRRCVLWGTTNDSEYLQSQNGNRRFWPVEVQKMIDLEKLARDRDQLWAEAAQRELAFGPDEIVNIDESLWGDARSAQELRRVKDPWEDVLARIPNSIEVDAPDPDDRRVVIVERTLFPTHDRVASQTLLERVLHIPRAQQTSAHAKRLATVMARLGWQKTKSGTLRVNGESVRGFWRAADEPEECRP